MNVLLRTMGFVAALWGALPKLPLVDYFLGVLVLLGLLALLFILHYLLYDLDDPVARTSGDSQIREVGSAGRNHMGRA